MKFSPIRGAVMAATVAMALGLSATAASAASTSPQARSASATAAAAVPAASAGKVTAPVTGTFSNADGTGTFTGAFAPKKFSVVNGALKATGLLTGTLAAADGTQLGTVSKTITTTVETSNAPALAACSVLNLTLGPLNLNLLGLVVQLNQIHLTITAVPGAGNLLGNLLCAVTGLLNGGGLLAEISALLNGILALL